MRINLVHNARFPVQKYGGTERVVWWLAKGLREKKINVRLICQPGSSCPFAHTEYADFSKPLEPKLPASDLDHYFFSPSVTPVRPYLVTIGGNGKPGEIFQPNTVFISRDHAERHGATRFVYNGLDPIDYLYQEQKKDFLLFLAKASWRVKNVRGAIRLARQAGKKLHIVGGSRLLLNPWRGVHWEGMLGGMPKAQFLSSASALLFPVIWNEPFGISVIEALMSGTPVIASPYGSLPELVPPSVGQLCCTRSEYLEAIHDVGRFRAKDCRDWAINQFHYRTMTAQYILLYEKTLDGRTVQERCPRSTERASEIFQSPI